MPAYVLVEVEVHDPVEYEVYKSLTPSTISAYDGRFVVRGGPSELLEGTDEPKRIVVLEFPSVERAREWWGSSEYRPARDIRQRTSTTRMILCEGAPPMAS